MVTCVLTPFVFSAELSSGAALVPVSIVRGSAEVEIAQNKGVRTLFRQEAIHAPRKES
jgi:hypothetical protein